MAASAPDGASEHGFFPSLDGQQLYYELWRATSEVRATVVVVHGFGDHGGRYGNLIAALRPSGFDVVTFDYRGHGQSGGKRGHIDQFSDYLDDVESAIALARNRGARRLVLLGHSLGGLIALRFALERGGDLAALVLSSPFMGLKMRPPLHRRAAARVLSRWVPRYTAPTDIDAHALSRDPAISAAYLRDRFVHNHASARWYTETSVAQMRALEEAHRLSLPLLVFAGGADAIASVEATRRLVSRLTAQDVTFTVYPGGYHELMNDTCKDEVLGALVKWLEARL